MNSLSIKSAKTIDTNIPFANENTLMQTDTQHLILTMLLGLHFIKIQHERNTKNKPLTDNATVDILA